MITIIGAGRDKFDMTLKGVEAIKNSDFVVVKTALTDTYGYFTDNEISAVSLDNLYEEATDFDDLDAKVVDFFDSIYNKYDNIAYVVNGVGLDDTSVPKLMAKFDTKLIAGVDYATTGLEVCPATSYTILSANYFVDLRVLNIDKRMPLIVKEIDNNRVGSVVKLWLAKLYGDEATITLFNQGKRTEIPIYELDRQEKYSYNTTILVKPTALTSRQSFDFSDLMEIMYILRGENGCSWDKAQTHETIRKNLVEEAYELVDAIDNMDIDNIIEETGDVLLQAVFHSVIAEQTAEFDIYEVISGLCNKLLSRHTHIFGSDKATNPIEALDFWEKAKGKEKQYQNTSDKMNKLAKGLPSVTYAEKLQKYAKKVGFDYARCEDAIATLIEEIEELKQAQGEDIEKEAGDVLFSAVNIVRLFGVNPEIALRGSAKKFMLRFNLMEELIEKDGLSIDKLSLDEQENYYQKAKKILNEEQIN